MAVRIAIDDVAPPAVARYGINSIAIEELNALIEKKRRKTLPDKRQVRLSLDSKLLAEDTCLFYMRDVQRRRDNDEIWLSEPFYCGPESYKMCLGVYPNGEKQVRRMYESVFLQLLEGEFDGDLRWPFKGNVTVRLLNQSPSSCMCWWSSQDLEKNIEFLFPRPVRSHQHWNGSSLQKRVSIPNFVQLSELHDSSYEVDDCSWYEVRVIIDVEL